MKREQRRCWLEQEPDTWLCGICRYAKYEDWGTYEEGCWEWHCRHALVAVTEHFPDMEPGQDCWGFRPKRRKARGGSSDD